MPRNLPNLFAQEIAAESQSQLFHLIQVEGIQSVDPNTQEVTTEEPLYLVDSNYDVTYQGVTYVRFPMKFSGVSVSSDGTIDKANITVANVERTLMRYVELYDGLAGCRVTVLTVYERFLDYTYTVHMADTVAGSGWYDANHIAITPGTSVGAGTVTHVANGGADPTACLSDEFLIDSYTANEQAIVFQLDAVVDFEIKTPRRRFTPWSCYWKYKDPTTCGYVGSLPTCKKSLADCAAHGNSVRFGGFPGVPSNVRNLWL